MKQQRRKHTTESKANVFSKEFEDDENRAVLSENAKQLVQSCIRGMASD